MDYLEGVFGFYSEKYGDFLVSCLSLISSVIPLPSENIFYMISIFQIYCGLLFGFTCIQFFVYDPCVLEKNVHSVITECSIL